MMEINVDLKGEQINEAISKAIMDSVLGDKLLKEVNEQVQKICFGYKSHLEGLVHSEVSNMARQMLRDEFKEKILEEVREKINQDEMISKAVDSILLRMVQADY